ncbi:MAG: hypothetical protein PUK25_00940, partial [Clostridiales bacterium]|nr:hypothetical protein [Clostridiales bacterium]MDY5702868.1 hypothetical protein [Eubacteriales bacterium]
RNAFPEIARGTSSIVEQEDSDICIIERTWNGSTITIVLNLCREAKSVSLTGLSLAGILDANISQGSGITYNGSTLKLDPWGIAILN